MLDKFENDSICKEDFEDKKIKSSSTSNQQDCCLADDSCNFKNNCTTQCCTSMKCENSDIEDAECVPIIADRIFDCICTNSTQFGQDDKLCGKPLKIVIDNYDADKMISGAPICINQISTSINNIGIQENDLSFKVGQYPVEFESVSGSGELVIAYGAIVSTTNSCECDYGIKTRISSNEQLKFKGSNLKIMVTGKIGCVPFAGHFIEDQAFDINGDLNGIYPMSIFSKLCLPVDKQNINLDLSFNPVLSIDCITPDPECSIEVDGDSASFKATVEYSFSVDTEIIATISEKLGVFVTGNEVVCKSGNKPCIKNNCK